MSPSLFMAPFQEAAVSPRPQSPASPPVVNDEDAEENCHEMVFIDSEKRPGADKLPSGGVYYEQLESHKCS